MKRILKFTLLIAFIMIGYLNIDSLKTYANEKIYYSICDEPITYRIGSIDERYNMSHADFLTHLQNSEDVWEKNWKSNLFQHRIDGNIEVNLVYDQRSFLSGQINELDSQVRAQKNELDPKIQEYKIKALQFQKDVRQLNADINYWNEQGGAPPEEFDSLITRQKNLQTLSDNLRQEADSLNQSTELFNQQIGKLQGTVNNFNQELAYKPEQGEYIYDKGKETINIYFDNSEAELVHTLAHEFGHALSIDHNNNPQSVMYPQTNSVIELSDDDMDGLSEACAEKSRFSEQTEKINIIINQIYQQITT